MQCACAVLSSVTYPAVPHFPINGTIFERKKLLNIRVLILSTVSAQNISHSKKK